MIIELREVVRHYDLFVSGPPRRSFAETGGRRRLKIQSGDVRLDQIRKKQMREQ
jgi:hypothetical protein